MVVFIQIALASFQGDLFIESRPPEVLKKFSLSQRELEKKRSENISMSSYNRETFISKIPLAM